MIANTPPDRNNSTNQFPKEYIMAKATTKPTPEDALAPIFNLRDLSIKLIREHGRWQKFDVTPVMCIKDHGNLSIIYLTPFQRSKTGTHPMGYALEIRVGRRLVLSLVWNSTTSLVVETYRPGAWEAKLDESNVTASLAA
jgi:hypothetical protein